MSNLEKQFQNPFETSNLMKATGFSSTVNFDYSEDDSECVEDLNSKGCLSFMVFLASIVILISYVIYLIVK